MKLDRAIWRNEGFGSPVCGLPDGGVIDDGLIWVDGAVNGSSTFANPRGNLFIQLDFGLICKARIGEDNPGAPTEITKW